jgi:low temperature requirement protein LtrA
MAGTLLYMREPRQATWLELFFDLIFVVAMGKLTHLLAHAHDGHLSHGVWPHFFLTFVPMWWIWVGHTVYNNRFDADTRPHRVATLVLMFLLMPASIFAGKTIFHNHVPFVICYCIARLFIVGMYYGAARRYPEKADFAKAMARTFGIGVFISLASVLFAYPYAVFVFFAGILFDMFGRRYLVRDTIPVDRDHLVERIGLLAIIMLGESVISLAAGLTDVAWDAGTVTTAVSGFILICMIWWIYFDSFPLLIESKRDVDGDAILYSQLSTYISFALLANTILHAVLNDLGMYEFRIMAMTGMFMLYFGKQTAYFVNVPEYRKWILINTCIVLGIAGLSQLLPTPQSILFGVTVSMAVYIGMNYIAQMQLYGKARL